MKKELRDYLKESHSARDIVTFIKEMTDSPSAEDVYIQMAFAIQELADRQNLITSVLTERN